jgi:NAD(P)H-hydrate epimerase
VGFVRVASPPENRSILQEAVPEAVYVDATDEGALTEAVSASRALGVGPGMGTEDEGGEILNRILTIPGAHPLLLDADALNLVALGRAPSLGEIGSRRDVVLTPHPGEMARLTGVEPREVTGRRPEVALRLARESGCTVLLKGAPSLIANPGGRLMVDTVGSSDLAAAGMGDVLSGTIAGFLAQGSGPLEAAALGLHTSGRAAVRTGLGVSLTPEDVVERLPEALREEGAGHTELDYAFVLFDQDPAR